MKKILIVAFAFALAYFIFKPSPKVSEGGLELDETEKAIAS